MRFDSVLDSDRLEFNIQAKRHRWADGHACTTQLKVSDYEVNMESKCGCVDLVPCGSNREVKRSKVKHAPHSRTDKEVSNFGI